MTSNIGRAIVSLGVTLMLVLIVFIAPARGDEMWVAPTYQRDFGGIGIASNQFWPVTPFGAVRLAWAIPNDLQTFQSAKVVLIPHIPGGVAELNIFVCSARDGDFAGNRCAGPFTQGFTGVPDQLLEVEIGEIIAPRILGGVGNYLAVLAYSTPTTRTDHIVGLRFVYSPQPSSGGVSLGANTFTGTQIAPAFVGVFSGSGAGLADLPFPSGAATLGSNTFLGTQTAPAFVGDGSGLTNLPKASPWQGPLFTTDPEPVSGQKNWIFYPGPVGIGYDGTTGQQHEGRISLQAAKDIQTTTGLYAGDFVAINLDAAEQERCFSFLRGHTEGGDSTFRGGLCLDPSDNLRLQPGNGRIIVPGTIEASAFIGDGSGLTNLPRPQGVASLGANVFTGAQTAPAFIGSGAGLTNLPIPPGVATLGSNTFIGTQTINGNIDLTAFFITKNGKPFLSNFGSHNVYLGEDAGNSTDATGNDNTAIGFGTLTATRGDENVAVGTLALSKHTSGDGNTAVGVGALNSNTGGTANTAIGRYALSGNNSIGNIAIGFGAFSSNTTGRDNIAIGNAAGYFSQTGSNNIYLGFDTCSGDECLAQAERQDESSTMRLGPSVNRTFVGGARGTTTGNADAVPVVIDSNGQLGTVSSSRRFKEDIHDMADESQKLFQLRPVTFRYTQPYRDGSKPIQYGLIAEEVAEVFPELAVRSATGDVETVHYETLNVLLLNEVQKQRRRIETLESQLADILRLIGNQRVSEERSSSVTSYTQVGSRQH